MIKTKEDLHHTFIDGSCEELKKKLLEKVKEFDLEVNPSAHKNVAIGINLAQVGKPSYFQVDHNGTHLEYYRDLLKYRELTLEDFEEEGKEEVTPTKYKYIPVEVGSIFDLREMFENGKLYFRWLGNLEKGSGGVGYDQITKEDMLICRYEEGRLLTREQVTWQDEVLSYLNKPSEEGFEEELPSKFRVDYMDGSFHLVDSEFLEMCRVALRATGELK